jgi:UDP-MurNAc hydroxylase
MRLTGLGGAGLLVETGSGTVLVDPWTTSAHLGAWHPLPANDHLDWLAIGRSADFLFVSQLAPDRFDPRLLAAVVPTSVPILLPDLPVPYLRERLHELGFHTFIAASTGEVLDLDGLRVMTHTSTSNADGPLGKALLWVSDGMGAVVHQHDARPSDLALLSDLGPVDVHVIAVSEPGWAPMVYDLPERGKAVMAADIRRAVFRRTLDYMSELGARCTVPVGPPCFLDDEVWHLNRMAGDSPSVYADQAEFAEWMAARGRHDVRLLPPGAVLDTADADRVPTAAAAVSPAVFTEKEERLRRRRLPRPTPSAPPRADLLADLRAWIEPLLHQAPQVADDLGLAIRLVGVDPVRGDVDVLLDLPSRRVRPYDGARVRYELRVDRARLERIALEREPDSLHSLLLSGRLSARRLGREAALLPAFLSCLSEERMRHLIAWLDRREEAGEEIILDGWTVPRWCPHAHADLGALGEIHDGVLTCTVHGWRWRLEDGRCLTVPGRNVRCRPADQADVPAS